MSRQLKSNSCRFNDRGQTLVLVPLLLVVLLGICALVIDLGNAYVCYQELVATTQAAAFAGGEQMQTPNSGVSATKVAIEYSGSKAKGATYNIPGNLTITGVTPTLGCVDITAYPGLGLPPCETYVAGDGAVNVLQVTETASVPTYFAKIFGVATVPISATATVAAKGGALPPYDIMLVLDTTASMGQGTDSNCVSGSSTKYTPEACAQYGVQTLLKQLDPCPTTYTTCPSGLSTAVDEVGLMVFPGLTPSQTKTLSNTTVAATANDDYDCNTGTNPSITSYNNNPEYLILGFQDDYRNSDTSGLNQGSDLFKSVGAGVGTGKNACGAQTPGGEGTFYAGVIIAAQEYLAANARTNVQNVIIFLSDGDATADTSQMGGTTKQTQTVTGMNNGLFSATAECTQAVSAADWAKSQGTEIYSISYGSETSGCTSGESASASTPCLTMQNMASTPLATYFYSVPQSGSGNNTTCPNAAKISQLSQVFTQIGNNLGHQRLIPNVVF
jgi:Flp pilus assembly protein TadG